MSDTIPPPPAGQGAGDRRQQAFPVLDDRQFKVLESYGQRRSYRAGEILFREGDRHAPMFVLLAGHVAKAGEGFRYFPEPMRLTPS